MTLVAFLPDSDMPHLTPRECDAARKALADHLALEGYTGAKVLNACGQAYLTGSLEPVDLPAYSFNADIPPPGYGVLAAFALASAVLMLCVAAL